MRVLHDLAKASAAASADSWRWVRWLGLAAIGVLALALAWASSTQSVDFPIYHRIGRQILEGDYDLYPVAVYAGGPIPSHGFRYMPAIAFLFVPFALLPLEAAALVFFVLKIAAFVYVGVLLARYLGVPARSGRVMLISLLCVGGYVAEEFRYGNFHFFCVALMVLAFVSAERGRIVVPAAALGVAIAAKLTPLLLLGYFAFRRRVAVSGATVLVLIFLWILPATVFGYRTNNRLHEGFAKYAVQKIDEQDNYALRGVLFRYLTPDRRVDLTYPDVSVADLSTSAVSTIWLGAVAIFGAVLAAALWREPAGPAVRALEFSIILTAMLLASPHSQRRYFTALYVPVVTLLALLPDYPVLSKSRSVRLAIAATAAASTFLPLLFGGRRLALAYEAGSPYFFATLVLFIALLRATAHLKRSQPKT